MTNQLTAREQKRAMARAAIAQLQDEFSKLGEGFAAAMEQIDEQDRQDYARQQAARDKRLGDRAKAVHELMRALLGDVIKDTRIQRHADAVLALIANYDA